MNYHDLKLSKHMEIINSKNIIDIRYNQIYNLENRLINGYITIDYANKHYNECINNIETLNLNIESLKEEMIKITKEQIKEYNKQMGYVV
ncbi:hypothetical protein [uncultured Clostridium sp.]|uniref:hypothetical protein n=1 Tax=uncultured Clostridium sp. TaxID=59620 RepID=UPI002590FC6E|nr:hypothetical protein [uncultured Clostridium sp.]